MDPTSKEFAQRASQQGGPGINQTDLDKATPIKCEYTYADLEKGVQLSCNNEVFQPGVELKKLSSLVSPTGQTSVIPVQIFYCVKCGSRYDLEKLQ